MIAPNSMSAKSPIHFSNIFAGIIDSGCMTGIPAISTWPLPKSPLSDRNYMQLDEKAQRICGEQL
jgi:hypothetical protein